MDMSSSPPQYACSSYGLAPELLPATIVEIYNANNGWLSGSYPNQVYGRIGQCGRRERWDFNAFGQGAPCATLAYHAGAYYCDSGTTPGEFCTDGMNTFIGWFYNHPDVVAQTAICSSYGLLQVMYPKAVHDLKWRATEVGAARDPAFLLDPCESLDMGCKFDAENIGMALPSHPANLLAFQTAMANGIQKYNWDKSGYGSRIARLAHHFRPQ
jgi:hypothetical protein